MTWRDKTVIAILLLVARIIDNGDWRNDIKALANAIALHPTNAPNVPAAPRSTRN